MNAPLTSLFLNPGMVANLGVPNILSGLPPTVELGSVVEGFGQAIEHAAPNYFTDWAESARRLQELLQRGGTPEKFQRLQSSLSGIIDELGEDELNAVLAKTGWKPSEQFLKDRSPVKIETTMAYVDATAGVVIHELAELVAAESVSRPGSKTEATYDSAEWIKDRMTDLGFKDIILLEAENSNPSVFGQIVVDPKAPTVLFYAHHDVKPPGGEWKQVDPFKAEVHNGRLFGRGAADDKAGIMAILSAVQAYQDAGLKLPVNVAVLFEGEEEIGSPHLDKILEVLKTRVQDFQPNVVVTCDSMNMKVGLPTVIASTRGIADLMVTVQSVAQGSHAGRNSYAMDAYQAFSALIYNMIGSYGELYVWGLTDCAPEIPISFRKSLDKLAELITLDELRDAAHMSHDANFLVPREEPTVQDVLGHTWRGYAMKILAVQGAQDIENAAGMIVPKVKTLIQLRIPPRVDSVQAALILIKTLQEKAPKGVRVDIVVAGEIVDPWETKIDGPAANALLSALDMGYGREAVLGGSGGGIGFLSIIGKHFPEATVLPIGTEDPLSNAHGPNESVAIENVIGTARSIVAFLYNISRRLG